MTIIKTKKQKVGKVSRDKKRYRTEDKRIKRLQQKVKYNIA